jgi:hypothetical protein
MATEPDLTRGRQGAQQALAELDNLSRRQAECDNEPLRSTLAGIARRKSGQTWRMLEWLRQHDTGHTPAAVAGNGEVIELRTLTPELIVFKVARPPVFQFGAGHSRMLEAVTQQLRPGGFRLETESYD